MIIIQVKVNYAGKLAKYERVEVAPMPVSDALDIAELYVLGLAGMCGIPYLSTQTSVASL